MIMFSYCDKNRMAHSSFHRKYNDKIPQYLINRPQPLVKHCMKLIDKLQGVDLRGVSTVTEKLNNFALFNSNSREIYQFYLVVAEQLPRCSCPAWFNDAHPCKHFFAIFIKENHTWSAFSSSYGSSPYFSLNLFSDENKYTNDILLQNNLVVHETPSSVTSQTEAVVQKTLSIKVNSSLD